MIKFNIYFINRLLSFKESSNVSFHIKDNDFTYYQMFKKIVNIQSLIEKIPDKVIGLYATDDIETYASILALWFLGKAYIPINPTQPVERQREIIKFSNIKHMLSSDLMYRMDSIHIINTHEIEDKRGIENSNLKVINVEDDELAYILFTSGSTGKPKGVKITRGNLAAFIDSMDNVNLDISINDRCLQPFDLTFDFSVSGFVIPLVKGASIFTVPLRATKFTYIAGLVEDYQLTVLQMVPSMIRNLLPYLEEVDLSSVRYNILCGEALTGEVIKKWHAANKRMISYNMYGPTEDTVFCTYYVINHSNIDDLLTNNDVVSIGKSFINSDCVVLNDLDEVINSVESVGELCLRGAQLTPGYLNNSYENEAKFFNLAEERYYRTGDLCYFSSSGNLMFVSRKDFQVKINGFRVELEEIENQYFKISKGRYSVVIPFVNSQGNTELAIVVEGREYDTSEHRQLLSSVLPAYEVPNRFLFIPSIPLNQNGKVDRNEIKRIFNLK